MRKTSEPRTIGTRAKPRADVLKQGLLARRGQLRGALEERIRTGRARGGRDGADDLEQSERDVQEELGLSLLQMESETLRAIDAALARLESGAYGRCAECQREIATRRLRALPFAIRCQVCQEAQEHSSNEARRVAEGRGRLMRTVARPSA